MINFQFSQSPKTDIEKGTKKGISYASAINNLTYVQACIRPDIACAKYIWISPTNLGIGKQPKKVRRYLQYSKNVILAFPRSNLSLSYWVFRF